jgi:hypothetical protein
LVYHWPLNYTNPARTIANSIKPPLGYKRIKHNNNALLNWYRELPLKAAGTEVVLYNNVRKNRQDVHEAIIDVDIGSRDLQQCADAVMRLRAEYLFSQKKYDQISFNFTNGQTIPYKKWREGYIIKFKDNRAHWVASGKDQTNYKSFRKYMNLIFAYAGTYSLSKELALVSNIDNLNIGDIFIQGGFPGHAVVVVDLAENNTGEKCFLLAQSYMPAQNIHVLKNLANPTFCPWYSLRDLKTDKKLYTPEWTFNISNLKRFK